MSGLSGAGKSEAMRVFEDLGYYCVDNLPPTLIPKFIELCQHAGGKIERVAIVSDTRGGEFFDHLLEALENLEQDGIRPFIIFLEASDEVLIRRFKETRRRHPMADGGGVQEGIDAERRRLQAVRQTADVVLDTTDLSPRQLRDALSRLDFVNEAAETLRVTVVSFGFRHGLPRDADLIFDVRFLPNPHYVTDLRPKTGQDPLVQDFIFHNQLTKEFMDKLLDFLGFLLPQYKREGKAHLIIGIGCTGGRHRSVAVAERVTEFIRNEGYQVSLEHRDSTSWVR